MTVRALLNSYFDDLRLVTFDMPERNVHGTGRRHAMWMIEEMLENEERWPADKFNRWMGYLQCILVHHHIRTLDQLREESRNG